MIQISELKQTGKKYWRSLEDLATTPQFNEWLHREFPEGADEMDGNSRRKCRSRRAAAVG